MVTQQCSAYELVAGAIAVRAPDTGGTSAERNWIWLPGQLSDVWAVSKVALSCAVVRPLTRICSQTSILECIRGRLASHPSQLLHVCGHPTWGALVCCYTAYTAIDSANLRSASTEQPNSGDTMRRARPRM